MQKSLGDIKTLHSINTHRGPLTAESAFLQLHVLAKEKHRLEKEVQFWERKSRQIRKRLEEVGRQMESLQERTRSVAKYTKIKKGQPSSLKRWKEMTLNY